MRVLPKGYGMLSTVIRVPIVLNLLFQVLRVKSPQAHLLTVSSFELYRLRLLPLQNVAAFTAGCPYLPHRHRR